MPGSTRSRLLSISALVAVVVGFALFPSQKPQRPAVISPPDAPHTPTPAITPRAADTPGAPPPTAPLFGERILEHYADPARLPEEDLQAIARTLENFSLLVKGDNPLPLGANEEIAAALRGKNRG